MISQLSDHLIFKAQTSMITTQTDKILGHRLRQIREAQGLSQEKLAKEIGVVFQQIQKYESGINRMSCSLLLKMLEVMHISIIDFFADIAISEQPLISKEEHLLVKAYRQKSPQTRQAILVLLEADYKFR